MFATRRAVLTWCWIAIAVTTSCKEREPDQAPQAGKPPAKTETPPPELGQGMPAPKRPAPVLWLQPTDLLTSTGQTPIRVMLDNGGAPVEKALLDSIASLVELRTYPGLEVVPVSVKTFSPSEVVTPTDTPNKTSAPPASTVGTDDPAYVDVQPASALADAWYVLSLKSIPSGVRPAPWSAPAPPAGAYAVRFHTGSSPVLSRVLICKKGPGIHRAVFEFSENVQVTGTTVNGLARVEQPSTGKACAYVNSGPLAATSMRWIDMSCAGFDGSSPWRVNLVPGLIGGTGKPVQTFNGDVAVKKDLDLATLPDGDNDCKVWRP